MKRRRTLAVSAGAIALILAMGFFWRQGVAYHTRSWHRAARLAMGGPMPWWDRICGTYTAQPREGHTGMTIGLAQFRDRASQRLSALLLLPLNKAENQTTSKD